MLRFVTDEDFNNDILRGLLRLSPDLDIVRVQDVGLLGQDDRDILEWASRENRILLTHDIHTMTKHAYSRINQGQKVSRLLIIGQNSNVGAIIQELLMITICSAQRKWENVVAFLPL